MIWLFCILIALLLIVDLFFQPKTQTISLKQALFSALFSIGIALLFNLFLLFHYGNEIALLFLTGYLAEKMLSIDNLAVFLLLFTAFKTPPELRRTVLFWGVLGAIVMRGLFIFLGLTLIEVAQPVIYLFALILLYMGIKFWFQKKQMEIDPDKNLLIKGLKRWLPVTKHYEGKKFCSYSEGHFALTPLFMVLIAIETADLIFALDSVPVIIGITQNPLIVYTSNIFAIIGLRSLYFVLENLVDKFIYLHYSLAVILIFIAIKMLFSKVIEIPILYTLLLILGIFTTGIIVSLFRRRSR